MRCSPRRLPSAVSPSATSHPTCAPKAMDQPRHGAQRKTVAPMFTPTHLDQLAINIRKRSAECLDNLPVNEVFDWVDRVSIELTTQMLAVLFDFPWEDRRKLTRWSDVATTL